MRKWPRGRDWFLLGESCNVLKGSLSLSGCRERKNDRQTDRQTERMEEREREGERKKEREKEKGKTIKKISRTGWGCFFP